MLEDVLLNICAGEWMVVQSFGALGVGSEWCGGPTAMPLKEYIAETMELLKTEPTPAEICVERVEPMRFAAESGAFDAVFQGLNAAMH